MHSGPRDMARVVMLVHKPSRSYSRPYNGVAEWDGPSLSWYIFDHDFEGQRTLRFRVWYEKGAWQEEANPNQPKGGPL